MAQPYTNLLSWDPSDPMTTRLDEVYSNRKMVSAQFERCSRIVNHGELRRLIASKCRASTLPRTQSLGYRPTSLCDRLSKNPPHHRTRPGQDLPSQVLDV